jgi:DMSO/TMAO reductase YedYZ molybdopterin-dependent catalytic subunit
VLPRPVPSTPLPADVTTVRGLSPYVTSNLDFYRIDTAIITPQVDAAGWRLSVVGLVDHPFELTYDELLKLDSIETPVTIQCVSNEVGGDLIGNAVWHGVPLATLLDRAAVRDEASQLVGRSVDGFTAGFPLENAFAGRTALVAYAMNGEPLPAAHGYPARLVVAGLYGYVSATKWLRDIEITTWDAFDGYWIPRGWSKTGPIKTQSRIDVPTRAVSAGRQTIAGVAWAPGRGISRVEVQIDDHPWLDAELDDVASDETWRTWHLPWEATRGSHRLRVRATDGAGETQTDEERPPAPDGATGWHTRTVNVS